MKKILVMLPVICVAQTNPVMIPTTLSGTTFNLNLQSGQTQFFTGNLTNTYGVNGNILGPTLILNRGDNVTMNVTNSLADTSTLHWHGMHVDPMSDGGPHSVITPGTTWSPGFTVMDWAATYWYHPHPHMMTNAQAAGGISGFIIVKDTIESQINLPRSYGIDDFPLVIQTKAFDANNQIIPSSNLDTCLMVNATIDPYLAVPGQVVRLRLLNGSSQRVYNLGFTGNKLFYQIASDGGLLSAPVPLTRLKMAPGERAEILVDFSALVGQSVSLINFGTGLPNGTYGALQPGMGPGQVLPNYTSNPLNGADYPVIQFNVSAPTANPVTAIPTTLVTHNPWLSSQASSTRTLTFSNVNPGPTAIQGPFYINGALFDMHTINYFIPHDNIEIWSLTNNTPIAHPFHIHDVQFYVLTKNGATPPLNEQGRKDVVLVDPMTTVTFITKFEDFCHDTMPYMYHCHMLTHEDDGMMGQFVVNCPVGVNELVSPRHPVVFPNPVTDEITIGFDFTLTNGLNYRIYNLVGETVELGKVDGVKIASLTKLVAGIYFLELQFNNKPITIKFVKE